jgi:copper chaperone CopZ
MVTAPRATILSADGDTTRLRIDGMVCDAVCATRTRRALLAVAGARDVRIDFASGTAEVDGPPQAQAAYERALRRVVVGGVLRRTVERLHRTLRRAA